MAESMYGVTCGVMRDAMHLAQLKPAQPKLARGVCGGAHPSVVSASIASRLTSP